MMNRNHLTILLLTLMLWSCSGTYEKFDAHWTRYTELDPDTDSNKHGILRNEVEALLISADGKASNKESILLEILHCHLLLDNDEVEKAIDKVDNLITPSIQGNNKDKTMIFHHNLLQNRFLRLSQNPINRIKTLENIISDIRFFNRYVSKYGQEEFNFELAELYFLTGKLDRTMSLLEPFSEDEMRVEGCGSEPKSAKRILYAKALLNTGQTARSLQLLNREIAEKPSNNHLAEALFQKAVIMEMVNSDRDSSHTLILHAAQIIYSDIENYGTQWAKYRFHLLDQLITAGKLEQAISYANELKQTILDLQQPNSREVKKDLWLSRVNARLAELLSQTNRGSEALKYSDEAIALLSQGKIESKKYVDDIKKQATANALRAGKVDRAEDYARDRDPSFQSFERIAKQLEESSGPVSSAHRQMLRNVMYYIENDRVNVNVRLNIRGITDPNLIPAAFRPSTANTDRKERLQQTTTLSEKYAEIELSKGINVIYTPQQDERRITDSWIDAAYSLYEATSDTLYLESGFKAIEYSRYNFLKELIIRQKIEDKLSPSLKEEFFSLKSVCVYWYKKETEAGYGSGYTDSLQNANDRLNTFLNTFAKDQLYDLKGAVLGSFRSATLQSTDEVFLHYYLSNEYLYIISRNSNNDQFIRKKIDPNFRSDVEYVMNIAMDFDRVANSTNEDLRFKKICENWNDFLMGDLKKYDNKTLVIFPHRELALVSWDYLDSKKGNGTNYLIQQGPIRYELSASLMTSNKSETKVSRGKLGAFGAENYKEITPGEQNTRVSHIVSRGGAMRLAGAQQEMKTVTDIYGGDLYSNTTPQMFLDKCADYDILLISTHGIPVINAKGLNTEILFEKDDNNKTSITDNDLYGRNINADLVVLSSCQTGIGELIEDEGIMSLGRTFIGSGSRSVLTSLHVLPDISSKKIFVHFFTNMAHGSSKSKALQLSKVNYLNTHNGIELHPIFWASPAVIGNDQSLPVPKEKSILLWIIGGSVFTLALLSYFLFKMRRRHS